MLKIICIGTFITGLISSMLAYTINYFNLAEDVENQKEIVKNEIQN